MPTFDRLQIGLNGSTEPNNFTIEIYEWNITGGTEQLRTTVATGVTRTTASVYNGGTLSAGTYGISGITGNDYYIKLTANNTCHTTATYPLRDPALALTVHTQPPLLSNYSSSANVMATVFTGFPTATTNSLAWNDLATFDDVFYLADDAPNYPSLGYGSTFSTNFTFTHLGTYLDGGGSVPAKWQGGLLNINTMTLVQSQSSPYKTYSVYAQQTSGIAADTYGSTYYSQYRVTFNPSQTSRTFTVYWAGTNV